MKCERCGCATESVKEFTRHRQVALQTSLSCVSDCGHEEWCALRAWPERHPGPCMRTLADACAPGCRHSGQEKHPATCEPTSAAMLGEAIALGHRLDAAICSARDRIGETTAIVTARAHALEALAALGLAKREAKAREAESEAIRRAFSAQVGRMEAFKAKVEHVLGSAVEEACSGGSADRRGVDGTGIPAGSGRGSVATGEGQAVAPETCWTTIIGAPTHNLGELPEKCSTCDASRAEDGGRLLVKPDAMGLHYADCPPGCLVLHAPSSPGVRT